MQGYGVAQNKFHKYDVYYHILHTIQSVEPLETEELTLLVRLAALFHDIAKPMVQKKVSKQDDPVYYNHEVVGAKVAKNVMKRLIESFRYMEDGSFNTFDEEEYIFEDSLKESAL